MSTNIDVDFPVAHIAPIVSLVLGKTRFYNNSSYNASTSSISESGGSGDSGSESGGSSSDNGGSGGSGSGSGTETE